MNPSSSGEPAPAPIPAARVEPERRLSWAWLLPIAALAFAVYLVVDNWGARGPLISVRVGEGHGIQAGDPLRYRGVQVGEIEAVRLQQDLSGVALAVRLEPAAAGLAREGARFWLVRPQLSLEGVQGLETILGANYLAVTPGPPDAAPARAFRALEAAPVGEDLEAGGLRVVLQAPRRFGLAPGAPISFREFQVGTVLSVELAGDATAVEVEAWIRPDYVGLIRENTRFWEVGGVEVDFGFTEGLRIDVGSLRSLLVGGIALATPDEPGPQVRSGQRFDLHAGPQEDWLGWSPALPIGPDAADGGATPPEPLRARLSWETGVFKRDHSRDGWLLPVPGGLIGPQDLLRPPENAREGALLTVDGQELAPEPDPRVHGELARARIELPAVEPWPLERVDWGPRAGDWAAISDPALAPLPISAARLREVEDGWQVDGAPAIPPSWHGAAVVDRASGQLVGLLVVDDERARILRPPAALWADRN
jgi:hypothetical protein